MGPEGPVSLQNLGCLEVGLAYGKQELQLTVGTHGARAELALSLRTGTQSPGLPALGHKAQGGRAQAGVQGGVSLMSSHGQERAQP